METNLGMHKFLPLILLGLFTRTTYTNNVSISEDLRRPRVSGRIVKLYSGIKPEQVLCSGEGFQEDPVDCAVFYRCLKGANNKYTVFRYECGPGTVYDPDTEICNHPKSTKRINCGGNAAPPTEAVNENEIDGSRSEIPSPISMKQVYSEQALKLEASTISTEKTWSSADYKSTPSASITHSWATTVKQHLRATRSPMPRQPTPESGEPCTSDGFMGDSENCRKFYRCVGNGRGGYIRYEFSCSELTIWDDETQSCNHAWAVKKRRCGRGSLDDENKNIKSDFTSAENEVNSEQTIQSQLQIAYGYKVNQVQTQISKGPVIQNQTQINYGERIKEKPNSSYTKQNQTQLSHGSAVSQTQTQISHGNKASQTQLQIDHSKESSQSQTQIHETNTDQTTASSYDGETQRPTDEKPVTGNANNKCTESGFMGDSDDCKKFYRCVDNGKGGYTKYEFTCGEGTVWDPSAEACNHEWAVKDCKNKSPSQTQTQNSKTTTTTTKPTTIETIPEEDEDVGYGSQNQQSSQTTTHQDKTSTTTESSMATQATEGNHISSSTSASGENICSSSGFMGDHQDCNKFYRCVDNGNGGYTRYEFTCGEGTVWDSNLEACNHAWAVGKCGKGTPDKNTQGTTTIANTILQGAEMDNGYPSQNDNNVDQLDQKPTEATMSSTTSKVTSASPTTSSPNTCTSSGFMGDKNDCKKFYRCVDDGKGGYIRYEFTCGEGTVWDQSIESCNHPSNNNKCTGSETATQETVNEDTTQSASTAQSDSDTEENNPATITTSTKKPANKPTSNKDSCTKEGFFGDTTNCKKFYRCVENQQGGFTKYDFTCGEGTVWDPEMDACNHESSVKECSALTNDQTQQQPSSNENAESSTSQPSTSVTSETTENTEQNQGPTNDACESEGFFANSADCKKFYRCVDDGKGGFNKYDFTCGDGTVWDQQSQTCNHELIENKCSATSETNATENPPSESGSTTQTTNFNDSTTSTTKRPDNEQSNNNDQCESDGFYANSNDCKKFYRCVSNDKGGYTKYDFTCGEGTIWVQEIQACDHDNDISNCSSQGSASTTSSSQNGQDEQPTTKASTTTSQSSFEMENNETSSDCSNNLSSNSNNSQSNECKNEGFYPNKNDCRKFYRCVDNGQEGYTKYDFTCGEGTAWDQDIQACNHENQVKNCQSSQGENQSEQGQNNTTEQNSSQTTEATSTTKTSTTESSNEIKPQTSNDKCENEGYFGDSNDCQKFYRCVDDGNGGLTKYDFKCGEGTIWDQDIQTCNHPGDVQNPSCNNNTTTTSTTTVASNETSSTTTTGSPTSSESSSSSSTTENSSDCSQGSTQKPQKSQVNCTKAGFYPDPDDCKKFYRCVDWDSNGQRFSVYHFECGEGTIWDPELETCNHEASVYPPRDCSGAQNTEESTATTTTTTTTTTTEKSTTQESTTTEDSTTQQSTTESSTTQETSTTEESTTEQTTTEKSTTTEKTTTQQSTTEQSTTEKSTTTERSTTQSSTTEQTTEQSSTTEQSTTENTTTDQTSTAEQSTTEQSSTTQQSTTSEQTTTEQSTTEKSTTTNEQSTTTTEQSTTEGTTESSTELSSTTEESTSQESSTTEQSSTEQSSESTTTEDNQESTTESSSSSSKDCPETENDQYLYVCPTSFKRHPKYCNMFYQCTEDNDTHDLDIAVFKCPNDTIYDESKNQCVDEKNADKKCDGEKADRRRVKRLGATYKEPIVASKEPLTCPSTGHFPFEKAECSPAFLKCDKTKSGKLRGYVNQCPDGYVYWSVSRRCEAKYKVRDCKKTTNDWSGRYDIPIERSNVAT